MMIQLFSFKKDLLSYDIFRYAHYTVYYQLFAPCMTQKLK